LAIGKIFFIIDIVLFLVFTALITIRFCTKQGSFTGSLHNPHESFFFGCFWVSVALILYNIQQYGTPSTGPWLVKTLEILFWMYAGCALSVAIFQYHIIFDEENLPVVEAMPAWILPGEYPFLGCF
jgi:tellurite resistance protein TehA-like permease